MSSEESSYSSESDSDSVPETQESEVNSSGILFFKKTPNDESRLAKNSIIFKRNSIEKGLTKDKRVTVQQVLDKRTYIRLKRLHGRGIFDFIYGVISTGKEANVYEAEGRMDSMSHRMAIKVYKTSILIFKDRSRYIEGEFRFRRSYVGTKNPRKMVNQWAEKEFRNLRRISLSGVYCPSPIALKDHILVMELIKDSDGSVSSKLKDLGVLPFHQWLSIYAQVITIMRILYQESKLIHADFSSYNLLYSDSKVIVIDVSQAVENDHPNAMYFLKRDCENITTFFTTINFDTCNDSYNGSCNSIHDRDHNGIEIDPEDPSDNEMNHANSSFDGVNQTSNRFNLLTSFQLFNFITKEMDFGTLSTSTETDTSDDMDNDDQKGVDQYVSKMVFTSKNAKVDQLRETIVRKRAIFRSMCRHVQNLLLRRDPVLFIQENYETTNYISNEAVWNSLNIMNLSFLSADDLDRLRSDDILPHPDLNLGHDHEDYHGQDNGRGHLVDRSLDLDHPIDPNLDNGLDQGQNRQLSDLDLDSLDDSSRSEDEFFPEPLNASEKDPGVEKVKFTGIIPQGIAPKDWKRMVKQMNRERREHKIPKHIKKGFKHKH